MCPMVYFIKEKDIHVNKMVISLLQVDVGRQFGVGESSRFSLGPAFEILSLVRVILLPTKNGY